MDKLILEKLRGRIKNRCPEIIDMGRYIRSAVLVPLLAESGNDWRVLFEVRSPHLQLQPGEICFPGGGIDNEDADPQAAAIRETCEELRISSSIIEIWGAMGMLVTPFHQIIYPFVGFIEQPGMVNPNPREVDEVFQVSLSELMACTPEYYEIPLYPSPPEGFPFDRIPRGRDYPWRHGILPEFFYEVEGRIIWGLTARILHAFLELAVNHT